MLHILATFWFLGILFGAIVVLAGTWLTDRECILRALGLGDLAAVSLPALPAARRRGRARVIRTVPPSRVSLKAA